MSISFGMHKLKLLTSKQDVRKEIYTEKKKTIAKAVIKAKNEMWYKICSFLYCVLYIFMHFFRAPFKFFI